MSRLKKKCNEKISELTLEVRTEEISGNNNRKNIKG